MRTIRVILFIAGFGLTALPGLVAGAARADSSNRDDGEFRARLRGAQEVTTPAGGVATDAAGSGELEFDRGLTEAEVELSVRGLVDVVGAHIHCAGAGQNGPIVVDLGVSLSGPVDGTIVEATIDNASIRVVDCTPLLGFPVNNVASLRRAADAGLLYFNVHTVDFPSGEIRGQLFADD
jgi:CHRD domain